METLLKQLTQDQLKTVANELLSLSHNANNIDTCKVLEALMTKILIQIN